MPHYSEPGVLIATGAAVSSLASKAKKLDAITNTPLIVCRDCSGKSWSYPEHGYCFDFTILQASDVAVAYFGIGTGARCPTQPSTAKLHGENPVGLRQQSSGTGRSEQNRSQGWCASHDQRCHTASVILKRSRNTERVPTILADRASDSSLHTSGCGHDVLHRPRHLDTGNIPLRSLIFLPSVSTCRRVLFGIETDQSGSFKCWPEAIHGPFA